MKRTFIMAFCYLAGAFSIVLISVSFKNNCDHIYVAVEPAEKPAYSISTDMEEKDIVCVKCFHVTKQKTYFTGAEDIGKMYVDSLPISWGTLTTLTNTELSFDILGTSITKWSDSVPKKLMLGQGFRLLSYGCTCILTANAVMDSSDKIIRFEYADIVKCPVHK